MSQSQPLENNDSISSQDPHREDKKKTKSRRPANTAFRQQRLKAWQPILTPKTVLPLFFVIGIIFAPIGGLLLYASAKVQELSIDYTSCKYKSPATSFEFDPNNNTLEDIPGDRVSATFNSDMTEKPKWGHATERWEWPSGRVNESTTVCIIEFNIPNDIKPPILFYYRLTNFYQNHRRYVKSLDIDQLKGKASDASAIKSGDCDPLKTAPNGKPYYPCGLIANSMFNDTFPLFLNASNGQNGQERYEFTNKGIVWSTEGELYGKTKYKPEDVVPPPFWQDQYVNGSYEGLEELPNLHENEPFQVWMRTAGLPTFSKLAMRNDKDTLLSGTYRLAVWDRYNVDKYGGTKSILISTRTVMGGKNPFLGIAYIVVGGICILLGAVFLATHLIKPRKLGDHTYLTWNNDQPSTATTTGRSTRPTDTA
ncbi:Lem3/Cdc50 [Aaosphaeria arxii CBS 175.79]|uniref:Lem3/Cdc50 n=1 Tax=Aaosphaeria arxii CBS 175.79 TaxID=1450172 RepID=A0A6A5XUR8_9PLEO|nr:Lem3/Cdc50 [Aaosphaeria arxii CBS 175.79]KAF2016451.1 Lem3/Cdc50 [Aaosphaeria arxii CBS 175.79]